MPVFFFQAEDGIRDVAVTGVQTCALPISVGSRPKFDSRFQSSGQKETAPRSGPKPATYWRKKTDTDGGRGWSRDATQRGCSPGRSGSKGTSPVLRPVASIR